MFQRNGEVLMNLSDDEQGESYEVIIIEVYEEYEDKEIESTKRNNESSRKRRLNRRCGKMKLHGAGRNIGITTKIRSIVHWFTMITMLKQRRRSSKLPSSLSER
jgi:hypothetical protein